TVNVIQHIARWQQSTTRRARRILEGNSDGSRGARYAVDALVALVANALARCFDFSNGNLTRVNHMNGNSRVTVLRLDEPAFNGIWPHAGENIAAVLTVIDARFINDDLGEQVIDIS